MSDICLIKCPFQDDCSTDAMMKCEYAKAVAERDALKKRVLELEWVLCEAYTALSYVQMHGSDTVVDEALKRAENVRMRDAGNLLADCYEAEHGRCNETELWEQALKGEEQPDE